MAVDREACAFYKEALDAILPPEYSEIVFTGNNNDPAHLKKWHLDAKREKQIRKNFTKVGEWPKILIVTEKLLTGFDAPILYAMYLDKPMRDHTLLQAIARVNRPYENEAAEMVKPHGFVLDFVGIFDKLEKALAFDSDEINAIVKDLGLLKQLFKAKMETKAPAYLALVTRNFDDKDVDNLIEHFRDKERRKEFFKEYKEIEMLYEIISPDAFLRPFIEDYATLSAIYAGGAQRLCQQGLCGPGVPEEDQRAGAEAHRRVDGCAEPPAEYVAIDKATIETIKQREEGKATKVINLVKAIEKTAEENSDDPFLVALSERAKAVQESFEDRQTSTAEALAELLKEIEKNEQRKKEQAAKGTGWADLFRALQAHRRRHPEPRAGEQEGARGVRQVSELAAERGGTARGAQAGDVRHLRRGGRHGKGDRHGRGSLHPAAKELPPMRAWRDKEEFKARVLEWAAKLGVKARALSVRPMRQQVGVVLDAGNLSFNDELLELDRERRRLRHRSRAPALLRAQPRQALEEPDAGTSGGLREAGSEDQALIT